MSAMPPIATRPVRRNKPSRCAKNVITRCSKKDSYPIAWCGTTFSIFQQLEISHQSHEPLILVILVVAVE